ncbi:hypothetical protein V1525DRAFT_409336 [Lipomyces kononenkoae]|uniref:Uncharacterized protein n=1 Tax=Lipomyces kononenkoae TaxID=34357 RepID=A0ACC3SVF7_LIPKO
MITIHHLPDETLVTVLSLLNVRGFLNASHVCSRWRRLTRVYSVLVRHIATHLCETFDERQYLHIISKGNVSASTEFGSRTESDLHFVWPYYLYLYILRRKCVALGIYTKYRIMCRDMTRAHPHFECATFSADGSLYVAVYRDGRTLPTPSRIIRVYNLAARFPRLSHSFLLTTNTDRGATDVVLSRDVQSLAIAFNIGYVVVYKLKLTQQDWETWPTQKERSSSICEQVYSTQFPSSIHSLAVSSGTEMLVLGCRRLGGLSIINLSSGEELDVPHYRLDLEIGLQARDEALCLRGWNETIVMRSFDEEAWAEKANIWSYFEDVLCNMESTCVQLEEAVSLARRHFFVGTKRAGEVEEEGHDAADITVNDINPLVDDPAENPPNSVDGIVDLGGADFDITEKRQVRLCYMPDDDEEDDSSNNDGLLRDPDDPDDPDDEGVRASKLLAECSGAYRVALSDDTSRLLVAQHGTLRLFSLATDFLDGISSYCCPREENDDLSVMTQCMNLIIERELKDRRAPMMSRLFTIPDLFYKPVINICFMKTSGIVVEYADEIVVYELARVVAPSINLRIDAIGEIEENQFNI